MRIAPLALFDGDRERLEALVRSSTARQRVWRNALGSSCWPRMGCRTPRSPGRPGSLPRWRWPPARSPPPASRVARGRDYLTFLRQVARAYPEQELHLVCDNYAAHKTSEVKAWLAIRVVARPRRGLVRDQPTSAHRPGHLHLGPRPDRQDPPVRHRLEPACRTVRLTKTPDGIPAKASRKKTSNTRH